MYNKLINSQPSQSEAEWPFFNLKFETIKKLDNLISFIEGKLTIAGTAILLSFILIATAAFYVSPSVSIRYHGKIYATLSTCAFDLSTFNYFRARILTSAIAQITGLGGKFFIIVPYLFALALFASIYWYFRKNSFSCFASFLSTSVFAFSSPLFTLLKFPGYIDTTTYLLLFWSYVAAEQKKFWWIFPFSLALLNHESALFTAPFMVFVASGSFKISNLLKNFLFLMLAMFPSLIYHYILDSHKNISFSALNYFKPDLIAINLKVVQRFLYTGIFMAFRLFWFIPFIAVWSEWKNKNSYAAILFLSLITGVLGQLILAGDISRLMGLAFVIFIPSIRFLHKSHGEKKLVQFISFLFLTNLLLPNFIVMPQGLIDCSPLLIVLIFQYFNIAEVGKLRWIAG
jgi:hypothetical protein